MDQQLVAEGVPVAVVDLLEVVEVDHRERELGAVALRTRRLLFEALVEGATIAEPRQRVACSACRPSRRVRARSSLRCSGKHRSQLESPRQTAAA